jgi:sugar-specific transcriptional regulator TrmB
MKLSFDYSLFNLEPRDLMVYEAMLANPEAASIRTIATQVGMNRGTIFEVIKKLVRSGLVVGSYKNSRKQYRPESPQALRRYAEERQNLLAEELPKVLRYADQLDVLQPQAASRQFGRLYEGEDEIAVLLQDVLTTVANSEDKSYRVISSAEVRTHLYRKFRNFTRHRIQQGIFVRVIGVGGTSSIAELSERKLLSTESVPASYVIIYGDKIAQITLTSLGDIHGSVVEDTGLSALQRLLFDKLWEQLESASA